MTDYPITPPIELVQQWMTEARSQDYVCITEQVAHRAAQWGADQELEACRMEIIDGAGVFHIDETNDRVRLAENLRSIRRPKPPSLKEQALRAAHIEVDPQGKNGSLIIRALEALPND